MKMAEGGGDGEVERWMMWQWTAALTRLMFCVLCEYVSTNGLTRFISLYRGDKFSVLGVFVSQKQSFFATILIEFRRKYARTMYC